VRYGVSSDRTNHVGEVDGEDVYSSCCAIVCDS